MEGDLPRRPSVARWVGRDTEATLPAPGSALLSLRLTTPAGPGGVGHPFLGVHRRYRAHARRRADREFSPCVRVCRSRVRRARCHVSDPSNHTCQHQIASRTGTCGARTGHPSPASNAARRRWVPASSGRERPAMRGHATAARRSPPSRLIVASATSRFVALPISEPTAPSCSKSPLDGARALDPLGMLTALLTRWQSRATNCPANLC